MDIAVALSENIANTNFSDLPKASIDSAKRSVLDTLGCLLAGTRDPTCMVVAETVRSWEGKPPATILGCGYGARVGEAAMVNAILARTWDLDDYDPVTGDHTAIVTLPVGFALAEALGGVTGKDFLTAMVVATDMIVRVRRATPTRYGRGHWWTGAFYVPLTAAAMAARVMGLDAERTRDAIGIGFTMVSNTMQGHRDGAFAHKLHQGLVTRGGLDAAYFAARGVTGVRNIFEGPQGFYKVYHQGKYDREVCLHDLGKRFLNTDTIMKRYPCVGYANDVIEACFKAVGERGLRGRDIKEMTVKVSETGFHMAGEQPWHPPSSVVGAQFNLPFAAATAVLKRRFGIEELEDFKNPEVCQLADRIKVTIDQDLQKGDLAQYQRSPVTVEILTSRGERMEGRSFTTAATHSSFDETARKFRTCAGYNIRPLEKAALEHVVDLCRHLEDVKDIREIVRALS